MICVNLADALGVFVGITEMLYAGFRAVKIFPVNPERERLRANHSRNSQYSEYLHEQADVCGFALVHGLEQFIHRLNDIDGVEVCRRGIAVLPSAHSLSLVGSYVASFAVNFAGEPVSFDLL